MEKTDEGELLRQLKGRESFKHEKPTNTKGPLKELGY